MIGQSLHVPGKILLKEPQSLNESLPILSGHFLQILLRFGFECDAISHKESSSLFRDFIPRETRPVRGAVKHHVIRN
jgi:hypothetical protein